MSQLVVALKFLLFHSKIGEMLIERQGNVNCSALDSKKDHREEILIQEFGNKLKVGGPIRIKTMKRYLGF